MRQINMDAVILVICAECRTLSPGSPLQPGAPIRPILPWQKKIKVKSQIKSTETWYLK